MEWRMIHAGLDMEWKRNAQDRFGILEEFQSHTENNKHSSGLQRLSRKALEIHTATAFCTQDDFLSAGLSGKQASSVSERLQRDRGRGGKDRPWKKERHSTLSFVTETQVPQLSNMVLLNLLVIWM